MVRLQARAPVTPSLRRKNYPGQLSFPDGTADALPLESLSELDEMEIGNLHKLSFDEMVKYHASNNASFGGHARQAVVVGTAVHWDNKMVDEIEFITPQWRIPQSVGSRYRNRVTVTIAVSMNGHEYTPLVPRVTEFLYYEEPEVLR